MISWMCETNSAPIIEYKLLVSPSGIHKGPHAPQDQTYL